MAEAEAVPLVLTFTLTEVLLNAALAALDERAERLTRVVAGLESIGAATGSEDAQRALVWNIAALHEANQARLAMSGSDRLVALETELERAAARG